MKPRLVEITKEQAFARGFDLKWINVGHNFTLARRFYTHYPHCVMFNITYPKWNTSQTRYVPDDGHIIYVKSQHGNPVRIRVSDLLIGSEQGETPQTEEIGQ